MRQGANGNRETQIFRELTKRSDATLRHGAHGNNAITCETDSLAIPSPTPRCAMERMETLHSPWMRASLWRCPTSRCAMERMETIGRRCSLPSSKSDGMLRYGEHGKARTHHRSG